MKKLILALTILPFSAFAAPAVDEISDEKIKNKFLTLVKDVEVEKLITGTSEFQSCRGDGFKATDDQNARNQKLQAATTCFKKQLAKKSAQELKKLATDLRLENYGLIKSKNVADITEYLSKKMVKSLTGQDPDEKDPKKIIENMKWEKQKIVDHKVFIDLYTNQLMKAALFEVSRFCFENLRLKSVAGAPGTNSNFADHWGDKLFTQGVNVADLTDSGSPPFLDNKLTEADLNDSAKLVSGLTSGGEINPEKYGQFFFYCTKAIPVLCGKFQDTFKTGQTKTKTDDGQDATVKLSETTAVSEGATACLTMEKLKSIRLTMKNTETVTKQFDEMGDGQGAFALKLISDPKFYERGKGKDEESPDELTSYSSADFIDKKNTKGDLDKMLEDCKKTPSTACDEYLVKGDSLDLAINNVETTMNLKREIDLATVKKLKESGKTDELKKFLEDNGHFEILAKVNGNLAGFDVEGELTKIYEARKVAEIETLKLKVGRRQISEKDYTALARDPSRVQTKIQENITDAKTERARMAQVMMFNNIITSQLDLETTGGKKVGRNVSGLKKELGDLEKSKTYNEKLFSGLKESAREGGSTEETTNITGGGLIDKILGKPSDKKN